MPVYEYRCQVCDHRFEQRRSLHASEPVRCPSGHAEVKRLVSMFAGGRRAEGPTSGGCCGGSCGCA